MTSAPVEGTRPSDAERDRALAVLREGAGAGRLSHDTFVRRMNFVLRAQSRGELADAIRDLPRAEPRVVTWLRNVRSKLPRPAIESNRTTAAHRTPAASAHRGPASRSLANRSPADRRADASQASGWLAALPRLTLVRRPAPAPLPALALPAPGSPTVRIGRGPGATLRLPDITVSRFHAELRQVDDGWMLRDLGSMNGTCVNDLRITTTVRVRPGDRVRFGAIEFTLTRTDQS